MLSPEMCQCVQEYRRMVDKAKKCKLISILEPHTGLKHISYEEADKRLSKWS